MERIKEIGLPQALEFLMTGAREAGQLAQTMQAQMRPEDTEGVGDPTNNAYLAANKWILDVVGPPMSALFSDASFTSYGRTPDALGKRLLATQPFHILLKPIHGVTSYIHGRSTYEVVIVICDAKWRLVGTFIYRPAEDEGFLTWTEDAGCVLCSRKIVFKAPARATFTREQMLFTPSTFVHLDETYANHADAVRALGYDPVFRWSEVGVDTVETMTFPAAALLTGACVGSLQANASLFDAAYGFAAECAGGFWRTGTFDQERLTYAYSLFTRNRRIFDLFFPLVNH